MPLEREVQPNKKVPTGTVNTVTIPIPEKQDQAEPTAAPDSSQ